MRSILLPTITFIFLFGVVACEPITPTLPPPTHTPITPTVVIATDTPTSTPLPVAFPTAMASPSATPTPSIATAIQRAVPIAPVVQLVAPSQNAQISIHQPVNIVVLAAAENHIARIQVTDDGIPLPVENPASPVPIYSAIVTWTPTQIGTHVIRAIAYDTQNRPSPPDEVTVTVLQDARKPTAIIVYPIGIPQIDLGSVLTIYGVATDEVGVTQVELWADNQLYTAFTSTNINGQPTFPFAFNWQAMTPGNHTFFVRAYDNQAQTTDSAQLKILVVGNQIPSLAVTFDRTSAPINEPLTITVSALDMTGIQKIEFLSGKEIFSTLNAARQTFVTTQVVLQNPNPGDYSILVRVYNSNGTVKESAPQIVTILRSGQSTPTPAPTQTPTRTRTPRATTTPRVQPPPAPKAEIVSPTDRFNLAAPLRVTFNGQASSELDRIELWAAYPGQANPQIICTVDARASTQKTGQCDWTPPMLGIVTLYAQAIDIYRQAGRSTPITGFIGAPMLPTATPTPLTATARWNAATASGPMTAILRQTGNTVRGEFKMTDATGRITSGTIRADRLTFSVDFSPEGATPTPNTLTMDFDCIADLNAGTLSCTYRDSRGRIGAAFFRREATP